MIPPIERIDPAQVTRTRADCGDGRSPSVYH